MKGVYEIQPKHLKLTDDGFTLAYSRRILEGQIPHLDFIIIRPFLSPLLHVPLVYFGGVHTYLLSRLFVWFEFACIAWLWIGVCERQISRKQLKPISKFSFALICFIVTVHSFPIMAWHTVDGLFFILLGQNFIFSKYTNGTCNSGDRKGRIIMKSR